MKGLVPSLAFGAGVALLLFGVILGIEPSASSSKDVWLEAWKAKGLKAQFRSTSPASDSWMQVRKLRDTLRQPEHDDSIVRRYQINMIRAEVLKLASPDLLKEIPEGRHLRFKLDEDVRPVHLLRSGKTVLFVSTSVRSVMGRFGANPKMVDRILGAFEESLESPAP